MIKQLKKWELTDTLREAHNKYNETVDALENNTRENSTEIQGKLDKKLDIGSSNVYNITDVNEIVEKLSVSDAPFEFSLDASNKDVNLWHPFVIPLGNASRNVKTVSGNYASIPKVKVYCSTLIGNSVVNGRKSPNSQHELGGVVMIAELEITLNRWGDGTGGISGKFGYRFSSKPPIMTCIEGSYDELVIWCLGGWKYQFYCSVPVEPYPDAITIRAQNNPTYTKTVPTLSSHIAWILNSSQCGVYQAIGSDNSSVVTLIENPHNSAGNPMWTTGNLPVPAQHENTSGEILLSGYKNNSHRIWLHAGNELNFRVPSGSTNLWVNFRNIGTQFGGLIIGNSTAGGKGTLWAARSENPIYSDYAELFPKNPKTHTEPGDIIVVDETVETEEYTLSTNSMRRVVGVHSDNYAVLIGGRDLKIKEGTEKDVYGLEESNKEDFIPVGLVGRLAVKVVGKIKKGEFIVPDETYTGVGRAYDRTIDSLENIVGMAVVSKTTENIERIMCRLGR
jgi:hypothetical protein